MKDPAAEIMSACVALARAETQSGVLEWYSEPIADLIDWFQVLKNAEAAKKHRS